MKSTHKRTAYDYAPEEFGTVFGLLTKVEPSKATPLESLMEHGLDMARDLRKDFGPGHIGCNYILQRADGMAVVGDFNIEGVMAPRGPERAGSELTRLIRECGAVRYVVYSNSRPAAGVAMPDISVVGCEPGRAAIGWVFEDRAFDGAERPRPKQIGRIDAWFTGLLDTTAATDRDAAELTFSPQALGEAAELLPAACDHMRRADGKRRNRHALLFAGKWRGQEGRFRITFDDEAVERGQLSRPLVALAASLTIADARSALVIEELGSADGDTGEGARFHGTALEPAGEHVVVASFEAHHEGSEMKAVLQGTRANPPERHEARRYAEAIVTVMRAGIRKPHTPHSWDEQRRQADTEVAEATMRQHGMSIVSV